MRVNSIRSLWSSALIVAMSAGSAAAQEQEAATAASAVRAVLPRDLSAWSMFWSADHVVKAVIAGLALASVITWTVALAKFVELLILKHRLLPALGMLEIGRAHV